MGQPLGKSPAAALLAAAQTPEALRHKQLLVATLIGGAVATGSHGKTASSKLVEWGKDLAETILREVRQ